MGIADRDYMKEEKSTPFSVEQALTSGAFTAGVVGAVVGVITLVVLFVLFFLI